MSRLFLTGATGFLGRRLCARLAAKAWPATVLSRRGQPVTDAPGLTVVTGDLLEVAAWRGALTGCDTVVHLAATTGHASAADHFRVNLDGTRALLGAARSAGVRRLLFVSSVAAGFPDVRDYPYARAKRAAEAEVLASGLAACVVRAAIIVGPGSSTLAALGRLARLPVIPVFGTGRVRVQPVWVDDLAAALVAIIERDLFGGETLGLGGRETLGMDEFLRAIRLAATGRSARIVHLPLAPLLPALRLAGRVAGPLLPVTPGQLASFRFDGTVTNPPALADLTARFLGVRAMLERSFAA